MTGSGGWSYFSATRYILGIRPQMDFLEIDPCIPKEWENFQVVRKWRGAEYQITVENPEKVMRGVKKIILDHKEVNKITVQEKGTVHEVTVVMG